MIKWTQTQRIKLGKPPTSRHVITFDTLRLIQAHAEQVTHHTYISVMFSLSCTASVGMLVILSVSTHSSVAKEHRQADGHIPKVSTGARWSRARTRGGRIARARSAPAMLRGGCSQHQRRGLAAVAGVSVCVVHLIKSQRAEVRSFHTLLSWLSESIEISDG